MTPSDLKRVGRDLLVWIVAFAGAIEVLSQAVQGILDERFDHFVLYFVTALALLLLAVSIERIKSFAGGF